jgi:hypothetical protein
MKIEIEINQTETTATVNPMSNFAETVGVEDIYNFDDFGQEMTTLELEDGRDFVSYDNCQTWEKV